MVWCSLRTTALGHAAYIRERRQRDDRKRKRRYEDAGIEWFRILIWAALSRRHAGM